MRKYNKKKHDLRRQIITINITFRFVYIIVDRKARGWKSVPQARGPREDRIRIELTVIFGNSNSQRMKGC